ncbi:hypothetical protein MKW94_005594 [Papaver nudicaule]|uniref:RNase H type-1 domain-containing protein n=1 Tax=Papaver nudicaule TaxID=74823 RepID=A0AA41S304_PAPNU|nr:hypothetical protein [Papaver nudicaule]
MWQLWKSRCTKIYEHKTLHPNMIIDNIKHFCIKYNLNFTTASAPNSVARSTHRNKIVSRWAPPPLNWRKLNFDAAFNSNTKTAGIGLIVRDAAGRCMEVLVKAVKATDAGQAEALAMLEAAVWISQKNYECIIVEGDCKTVIEAVSSNFAAVKWQDHNLLSDISRLLEAVRGVKCVYVPRSCNEAADALAKHAKRNGVSQLWQCNPPRFILPVLQKDNQTL